MSPRTVAPVPLDDPKIWRRVKARLHPDAGGDDELFVFATAVEESVGKGFVGRCSGCIGRRERAYEPPWSSSCGADDEPDRIPFAGDTNFAELTRRGRRDGRRRAGALLRAAADACRLLRGWRGSPRSGDTGRNLQIFGGRRARRRDDEAPAR